MNIIREIRDLQRRIKILENGDNSETFKALGCSVFEGTANLQEELVILKMKLENHEVAISKIKNKINEIIRNVKNQTE